MNPTGDQAVLEGVDQGGANRPLGREAAKAGAPHIPPPNETGTEGMGTGTSGARKRSDPDEWLLEGEYAAEPPPVVPANLGVTKYPFAELEVRHAMRIYGRDINTVRGALKRWVAKDRARKALKFQVWKAKAEDGRAFVRVKRIR